MSTSEYKDDRYTFLSEMHTEQFNKGWISDGMREQKLKDENTYGIHTGEFSRRISKREIRSIKMNLGVPLNEKLVGYQRLLNEGITELSIKECHNPQKPFNTRYYLVTRVNFAMVLSIGRVQIMPYKTSLLNEAVKKISRLMKGIGVEDKNSSFQSWTIERLDIAIEIKENNFPNDLMEIMNETVNPEAAKHKRFIKKEIKVNGKSEDVVKRESMLLGNNSAHWNIYVKEDELREKTEKKHVDGTPLSNDEEDEILSMHGIIRFERQNLTKSAIRSLLGKTKVEALLLSEVRNKILTTMISEIQVMFQSTDEEISSIHPDIEGICFRILKEQDAKRPYHDFPTPHLTNEKKPRYTANIPICSFLRLYDEHINRTRKDGNKAKIKRYKTIKGKSIEEYEWSVFQYLNTILKENYIYYRYLRYKCDFHAYDLAILAKGSCNFAYEKIKAFYGFAKTLDVKRKLRNEINRIKTHDYYRSMNDFIEVWETKEEYQELISEIYDITYGCYKNQDEIGI